MPIFKKTYHAGGFRIAVAVDDPHFIKLMDDYFWTELPPSPLLPMRVTINVSSREIPVNLETYGKKLVAFKNSLIDVPRRTIYTYCPSATYPEQVGALFWPLSCLMMHLGFYPIHGALSRAGREFIAILGPSGCGKSTLSSHLALNGFPLLCDDCFFLKKVAGGFKLIPFYKRLNVKNISDPHIFRCGFGKSGHIKPFYGPRKFTVIFPKYSDGRKTRLEPMTRKEGALRLIGGNLALETGHTDNGICISKMFQCLMQFEESSSFFKLTYQDRCLRRACSSLCRVLGKRYEPRWPKKK